MGIVAEMFECDFFLVHFTCSKDPDQKQRVPTDQHVFSLWEYI